MNLMVIISGLIHIGISLVVSVLFLYGAFQLFRVITRDIDEIKEIKKNNISLGLLNGAIIFSIIIAVLNVLEPTWTMLNSTLRNPNSAFGDYMQTGGLILLQFVLAGMISFLSIWFSVKFFTKLTREIDEFEELKKNNLSVGIILSVVIVSVVLFLEPGIKNIMETLVPLPQVNDEAGGIGTLSRLLGGLIFIVASLVISVLFLYGSFELFRVVTRKIDGIGGIKKNNIALALVNGSIIFSIVLAVKNALIPAWDVLHQVMTKGNATFSDYLTTSARISLQFVVAGLISFLTVLLAIKLFTKLTSTIDEFAELKKNNIAIGIILSIVILSVILFVEPGINYLLSGLVPLPPPSDMLIPNLNK